MNRLSLFALGVFAVSLLPAQGFVDKRYSGSGDWNVAANWTGGTLPSNVEPGGGHSWLQGGQTITIPTGFTAQMWVNHIGAKAGSDGAVAGTATVVLQSGATLNNVSTGSVQNNDFRMGRDDTGDGTGVVGTFINQGGILTARGFSFGGFGADDVNARAYFLQDAGSSTFSSTSRVGFNGQGTLILNGGTFSLTGGGSDNDPRLSIGHAASATGYLEVNGGTLNLNGGTLGVALEGANPRGTVQVTGGTITGVGNFNLGNDGSATYLQSGGLVSASQFQMSRGLGSNSVNNGPRDTTAVLTAGTLSVGSSLLGTRGDAVFTISGGTFDSGSSLAIRHSSASAAGDTTVFNQQGGMVLAPTINFFNGGATGNGTFNLEGGTLRVNTVNLNNNTFNWAGGVLTAQQPIATDGGSGDPYSQPIGPSVNAGRVIQFNGSTATTAGGNASTLDLGPLYLNSGVRQNRLHVTGNLNLAAADDTLIMGGTPYLLRPFGFFTEDYGTIPLVSVAGTMSGTFETFVAPINDSKGWMAYTGVFTSAASLPMNSWYLEQTASGAFFHYRVQGAVPEPGSFGLLALGGVILRRWQSCGRSTPPLASARPERRTREAVPTRRRRTH
jgi:hypothetical protein